MTGDESRPRIDTTVPHSARIWNYWLGGKDNYPVDRQVGEQTIAVLPEIAVTPYTLRGPEQIAAFLAGLELVEPGLVPCPRWRPDPGDSVQDMDEFCALGRKSAP